MSSGEEAQSAVEKFDSFVSYTTFCSVFGIVCVLFDLYVLFISKSQGGS